MTLVSCVLSTGQAVVAAARNRSLAPTRLTAATPAPAAIRLLVRSPPGPRPHADPERHRRPTSRPGTTCPAGGRPHRRRPAPAAPRPAARRPGRPHPHRRRRRPHRRLPRRRHHRPAATRTRPRAKGRAMTGRRWSGSAETVRRWSPRFLTLWSALAPMSGGTAAALHVALRVEAVPVFRLAQCVGRRGNHGAPPVTSG